MTGVNVFDIFEGASLGEGKKSVAIEVQIQPADRTLTDEDFEALTQKIIANVAKSTGGVLGQLNFGKLGLRRRIISPASYACR